MLKFTDTAIKHDNTINPCIWEHIMQKSEYECDIYQQEERKWMNRGTPEHLEISDVSKVEVTLEFRIVSLIIGFISIFLHDITTQVSHLKV